MTQGLMIILDNDHGQDFINSIGRDMINTSHAYFEKCYQVTQKRFASAF
jgi:hypothetical protein